MNDYNNSPTKMEEAGIDPDAMYDKASKYGNSAGLDTNREQFRINTINEGKVTKEDIKNWGDADARRQSREVTWEEIHRKQ